MTEDRNAHRLHQGLLDDLIEDGVMGSEAHVAASQLLRASGDWRRWAEAQLLALGTALLLAGIVFFFAFNWSAMPGIAKLAAIQGALVISLVAAWWRGLDRAEGRALVTVAAVLTGVFLAVFGQIYQTGADVFELFRAWALLILPWALLARSAALWTLWWVVMNLWITLWWGQVLMPDRGAEGVALLVVLAAVNGLMLLRLEIGVARGEIWFSASWQRVLVLAAVLVFLTIPVAILIVDIDSPPLWGVIAATLTPVIWWTIDVRYRRHELDVAALGLGLLSACTVLLTMVGKLLALAGIDDAIGFLLFGFSTLLVLGGAGLLLGSIVRRTETSNDE